jgi:hypothetical protein
MQFWGGGGGAAKLQFWAGAGGVKIAVLEGSQRGSKVTLRLRSSFFVC